MFSRRLRMSTFRHLPSRVEFVDVYPTHVPLSQVLDDSAELRRRAPRRLPGRPPRRRTPWRVARGPDDRCWCQDPTGNTVASTVCNRSSTSSKLCALPGPVPGLFSSRPSVMMTTTRRPSIPFRRVSALNTASCRAVPPFAVYSSMASRAHDRLVLRSCAN